jgi:hypothetical protein
MNRDLLKDSALVGRVVPFVPLRKGLSSLFESAGEITLLIQGDTVTETADRQFSRILSKIVTTYTGWQAMTLYSYIGHRSEAVRLSTFEGVLEKQALSARC